ncbi:unnamed protein product [Schistocephalus solidus]|uniref:MYND-type domain-containing protein n=1 Tax=Schistocephalus solidus TaxID=70667 RepID=A0A183SX82_SCHSO|nr:unnamed protein product [Schistocephalus solidus]
MSSAERPAKQSVKTFRESILDIQPKLVLAEATKCNAAQGKAKYEKFLRDLSARVTNPVLDSLPSVNGIPRSAFLYRFAAVSPFITSRKLNMASYLDSLINLLAETVEEGREASKTPSTSCEKYDALRQLREIAASDTYSVQMSDYIRSHPGEINRMIIHILDFSHTEVAIEACFTIAFLARRFHFELYDEMDSLIAALVRMVAVGMVPLENYVTLYREEADRHKDREMVSSRALPFYFQRMPVEFSECQHRMVGMLYYTIADLLFSLPWPKLILFFECRIFRRKEMTRTLLFDILASLCMNLRELRNEADRLSKITPPPQAESAVTAGLWDDLPANMYLELLRACNDKNPKNSALIEGMMSILRASAPVKLPIFEEDALRVFEYYFQGTTEDKVQFGRQSVKQHGRQTVRNDSSGKPVASPNKSVHDDKVRGSQTSVRRSERKKRSSSPRGTDSVGDGRQRPQRTAGGEVDSEDGEAEKEVEYDYDESISDGEVDFTTTRTSVIPARLPDIFQIHRTSR